MLIDTSASLPARRPVGQGEGHGSAGRRGLRARRRTRRDRVRPDQPTGARLPRVGRARALAPAGGRPGADRRTRAELGATDLGQGLIDAVAAVEDVADSSERTGRMPRRIVLVSDLQQGSRLEALGELKWPSDVELEIKTVSDDSPNAGLQRLADPVNAVAAHRARASRSRLQRRRIPPRTVRPAMDGSRRRRARRSDRRVCPARRDSRRAHAPAQGQRHGPGDRAQGRLGTVRQHPVYPRRAEAGGHSPLHRRRSRRRPERPALLLDARLHRHTAPDGQGRPPADDGSRLVRSGTPDPLVILTAETSPENVRRLRANTQAGGTLLYVATRANPGETLAALMDVPSRPIEEASSRRDVLISEIAFDHPLFAVRRPAVQRFHQDPLLEAPQARGGRDARPGSLREWRSRGHREADGQGERGRHGQRMEPRRQPARGRPSSSP